jgi:hypothetical protein
MDHANTPPGSLIYRTGARQMIEQRANWQARALPRKRPLRPGTTTAFALIVLAAVVALALGLTPAFAASPGGMLILATVATAAGLYCHRLLR